MQHWGLIMSFLSDSNDDEVMNEINMTPLMDVMLVLLIVFILAVPAIQSAIALTLPKANPSAAQQLADPIRLDMDAQGQAYWNGKQEPPPVVRLSGDRAVSYERVLQTLSTLQSAGLSKVNFMSQKP